MYKWSSNPGVISFSPRLELQKNIEIGLVSVDTTDNSSNVVL